MQTFVVVLIGMLYGWKLGVFTVALYLFEGAIGLPVFASGGGLAYLIGPTAGYLYGMLFASIVISYFANLGYSKTYFKTVGVFPFVSAIGRDALQGAEQAAAAGGRAEGERAAAGQARGAQRPGGGEAEERPGGAAVAAAGAAALARGGAVRQGRLREAAARV